MTYLLLETALLMLAAYFLGAVLACLFKRTFAAKPIEMGAGGGGWTAASPDRSGPVGVARSMPDLVQPKIGVITPVRPDPARFERALAGTANGTAVAPSALPEPPPSPEPIEPEPVVELQPAARAAPASTEIPRPSDPDPISPPSRTPEPFAKSGEPAHEPAAAEPTPASEPQPEYAPETVAGDAALTEVSEPAVAEEAEPPPVEAETQDETPAPVADEVTEPQAAEPEAAPSEQVAAAEPEPPTAEEPSTAVPTEAESEPAHDPEPVTAGVAMAAAAAAAAAVAPSIFAAPVGDAAPASGPADDLTRIRTIDPLMQKWLNESGVWRFADIAQWGRSEVNRFSQALGVQGRIEQENWIGQAEILARGGEAASAPPAVVQTGAEAAAVATAAAAAAAIHAGTGTTGALRDRLTRITGVTPDFEAILNLNGIGRFAQIAAWTPADMALYESKFSYQPGRIAEENWTGQADVLARGGDPDAMRTEAAPGDVVYDASASDADAVPSDVAPTDAETTASESTRGPVTGLRSVKSEALIDPNLEWSTRDGGTLDDLKRIRGIGVLIEKKLNSLGITSYEQIANWTGADVYRLSQLLDFKGRIERENWIEQARILASGGHTEFSRRVDRGEV